MTTLRVNIASKELYLDFEVNTDKNQNKVNVIDSPKNEYEFQHKF